jgi:predicted DCC family thiol-disulfide oxidoreductase YuxK
MTNSRHHNDTILFFDGVCNLCNSSVDFVLRNDREHRVLVAPLQGTTAREILLPHGIDPEQLDSLVLWKNGNVYRYSDAALQVAGYLRAPWSWGKALLILPRALRDPIYKWIARNRYKIFGKKETCRLPTPEERARFIED